MSKIETFFPTYLYRGRLTRVAPFNVELKREIAALEKIDDHGRRWSKANYLGGYSSYSSMDQLHRTSPNFAELEKRLAPHVDKFVRKLNWDLMGREIRMTTCWANSMGKSTHHTMHMHPSSILSGVYYVDTPPGSSALKFEDPRLGLFMAAPPRRASAPAAEKHYLSVPASPGSFLIFESWMRHEVPPHQGTKNRLSISFNYEWI